LNRLDDLQEADHRLFLGKPFGILPRPGGIFFSPDSFSGSSFYLSTAEFRDEKGLNDTILSLSLIKFLRALHPLQF
jgi:hypothetical protein